MTDKIIKMYEEMILPSIEYGLCGYIYTQLSDIEEEINGFYTYDRQICKVDTKRLLEYQEKINEKAKEFYLF